jgi:pre-60S factor REI1
MEFSDYYDFSSSYSNPKPRRTRHRKHKKEKLAAVDEEWEDAEDVGSDAEEEEEEVIEEGSSSKMDQDNDDDDESDDGTSSDGSGTSYTETDDSLSDSDAPGVTFDPESMELVLPSGRRIGHRSLQRYYDQRPSTHTHAGALELVPTHRRSIKDKTDLALVSAKGGFGDKGRGGEVMRARNKGEAKNAAKNPYKAMQTREKFKMRVGSTSGNNMKYVLAFFLSCRSRVFDIRCEFRC